MLFQKHSRPLDACLACGSNQLIPTLDLGSQPLANSYKDTKEEVQEYFPLAINRCAECFHLQLSVSVKPDLLFKNYLYVSGTSRTMYEHFRWFAAFADEYYTLVNHSFLENVLDIGCNDGSQLNHFKDLGIKTYGIDPALNLYNISSKNHTVFPTYFGDIEAGYGYGIVGSRILVAQNVFAHNRNPLEFLETAKEVMNDQSLLFIQTSQADMILNNEFDSIYHEHLSFFNINSMQSLCRRAGMYLIDVIKCPIHGNSYIFIISKNEEKQRPLHIENLIDMERKFGLYDKQTYVDYEKKVTALVEELRTEVGKYSRLDVGFNIVGYGAAAKGMTLLNYSGIKLDYIIDDNPLKQGKFTPGSSVEICSIDKLDELKSACLFIPLAWNFYDEIRDKIKTKRNNKYDRFLTYFPKVEVKE